MNVEDRIFSLLKGKKIDDYTLHIDNISQGRFAEEINFELYLKNFDGEISENSVVKGKYFSGRGEYKPWLEVYYDNYVSYRLSFVLDISKRGLDEKLFNLLLSLIPPGSSIMVIYLNHEKTRKSLEMGIPAPATPIGYLLWKSGCTWFKDWYFSEGFWEGSVKLQGNKPLNKEDRGRNLLDLHQVLNEFLKKEIRKEKIFADAKTRAKDILQSISRETKC